MIQQSKIPLTAALYPLGAYYLFVPVVDVLVRALPMSPGNPAWRYALVGLAFTNLGTISLGLAAITLWAYLRRNAVVLRVVAVLGFIGTLVLLAGMASFALDALQLRGMATGQQRTMFGKAAATASVTAVLGTLTVLFISIGAWRAARTTKALPGAKASPSLDAAVPMYSTISGGLTK